MATTDSVSTAERKRALATERKRRQRGRMAAADAAPSRSAKSVKRDESRVASRSKRDPMSSLVYRGRLANPDRTLVKFGTSDGIGLYTRVLHQFANVAGYCKAWIDHVLVTDRAIKPATSEDPAEQTLADEAAERMRKAWARVRNRSIVLQKLLTGRFYGFARAEKVWNSSSRHSTRQASRLTPSDSSTSSGVVRIRNTAAGISRSSTGRSGRFSSSKRWRCVGSRTTSQPSSFTPPARSARESAGTWKRRMPRSIRKSFSCPRMR
jgi:hypothetical protein